MNITPLKQKFLKVMKRSRSTLQDLSSKRWTICPSEQQLVPPAIFLEQDLTKITAVMEDTTLEQEMARIRGGQVEHAATIAYQLSDCQLLNGSLYKSSVRYPLTKQAERLFEFKHNESIAEGVLAGSYYGSFYFGHWLTDDLSLYLAAESLGKPVIPQRPLYGHESGYCELTDIQPEMVTSAHFQNLVIFDDFGQNSFKRARYEEIRTRLLKIPPIAKGGRVLIRRGQQGAARVLTNAAEIEQLLISQGFYILDPEHSTVQEIVAATQDARLVVGLEGSHLLHCIYTMAQNGGLCVLQPPYRFNNVLKNYADCLGISYGFVIGQANENGFSINPDELLHVLNKIDSALPA
jgi:capsular polysaccharide biosynthesis protein